jgi:hypothetical protein
LLISSLFFESFFENPRNLFTNGDKSGGIKKEVYTGLFAVKSNEIEFFLNSVPITFMCERMISIEDILAHFLWERINLIPYADVHWLYAGHTTPIRF